MTKPDLGNWTKTPWICEECGAQGNDWGPPEQCPECKTTGSCWLPEEIASRPLPPR